MSRYFIELSDSPADRLYLKPSEVDTVNYDNNRGYLVYTLADFQGDFCLNFPTEEAREEFIEENSINAATWNAEILRDQWCTYIWEVSGDRETELCECLCDVDVLWIDTEE